MADTEWAVAAEVAIARRAPHTVLVASGEAVPRSFAGLPIHTALWAAQWLAARAGRRMHVSPSL